jgi:hypothetical protein
LRSANGACSIVPADEHAPAADAVGGAYETLGLHAFDKVVIG